MIKLKEKEVFAFMTGLERGAIGYSLSFNNSKIAYKTAYECKAFKTGYEIGCTKPIMDFWATISNTWSVEKTLLKHCIDTGIVEPVNFKLHINPNYFTLSIDSI